MAGTFLDGPLRAVMLAALMVMVADSVPAATPERAQLAEARQRIESEHAERVAQCRQQFVVTSCVEAAEARRREGLTALQAREAEIDDGERKARAQARQSRIDAKQQRKKDAPTPVPLVPADSAAAQEAAAVEAARAAGRTMRLPAAKPAPASPARSVTPKAVDAKEEAARFDARQTEARSRKAAAAERQKERERSGEVPRAPLPPVGGASAAR
jgi:hypothetical protein